MRKYTVDIDGDISQMKTTISILNQEQDQGIFVDTYSTVGFRLNSGIRIMGPCAVFPRSVLHWNVGYSVRLLVIFQVFLPFCVCAHCFFMCFQCFTVNC